MLEYRLSSNDKNYFTNLFTQKRVFLDMLAYRFSKGEPRWLSLIINEGKLYIREDIEKKFFGAASHFEALCIDLDISEREIIAFYKERVRRNKYCIVTQDGTIFINGERFSPHDIKFDNINLCISESFKKFLFNFAELYDYSHNNLFYNPVCRFSYKNREDYYKFLLVFFIEYGKGMTAGQIFHLTDILRCFDISSETALKTANLMFEMKNYDMTRVLEALSKRLDRELREYLLIDCVYMIGEGGYDCMSAAKLKEKVCALFDESISRALYIEDKIRAIKYACKDDKNNILEV